MNNQIKFNDSRYAYNEMMRQVRIDCAVFLVLMGAFVGGLLSMPLWIKFFI